MAFNLHAMLEEYFAVKLKKDLEHLLGSNHIKTIGSHQLLNVIPRCLVYAFISDLIISNMLSNQHLNWN